MIDSPPAAAPAPRASSSLLGSLPLAALLPLALLATAPLATGCGPSEERASEIALHAAIERLRDGNGPGDRRARIAAVRDTPARTPAARDARTACVLAYTELTDAEDAISAAEAKMKTAERTGELPVSLLTELASAEELLTKAKADMPACDAAAAKLAVAAR